jgi:hypothetical protein
MLILSPVLRDGTQYAARERERRSENEKDLHVGKSSFFAHAIASKDGQALATLGKSR